MRIFPWIFAIASLIVSIQFWLFRLGPWGAKGVDIIVYCQFFGLSVSASLSSLGPPIFKTFYFLPNICRVSKSIQFLAKIDKTFLFFLFIATLALLSAFL